jgi:hypothetical protein
MIDGLQICHVSRWLLPLPALSVLEGARCGKFEAEGDFPPQRPRAPGGGTTVVGSDLHQANHVADIPYLL